MRQKIADQVQRLLPEGWVVRAGTGEPPWWLVTATDGQTKSLMGLGRLSQQQLENRVKGLVARLHLGAHVRASEVGHRDPRNGPQESVNWNIEQVNH